MSNAKYEDDGLYKVDVAGVKIFTGEKGDFLNWIQKRINAGKQAFVATPYGEFLYEALRNPEFQWILNQFDANIADGVSVLWSSVFLERKLSSKFWPLRVLQAFLQVVLTGSWILLKPFKIRKYISEKISGSDVVWDLAGLAEKNNWSVMLAGGFGDTVEIAKKKLTEKFPRLNVVGTSSAVVSAENFSRFKSDNTTKDESFSLLNQIQALKPDVLLLCLGPFKQERFLIYNREKLPVRLAIGLGGTFDYIAGRKKEPPRLIREIGLEWLFRLFTQPTRIKRIYNATFNLVISLVKYKVYQVKPYRPNVAVVVLSQDGRILLCRRRSDRYHFKDGWNTEHWQLPQGGVSKGETIEETAIREVGEETGLVNLKVVKSCAGINKYVFPIRKLSLLYPSKYKGQVQSLVFLQYRGELGDVRVDDMEFDGYSWVRREDLIDRLHPARKDLGRIVLESWPY